MTGAGTRRNARSGRHAAGSRASLTRGPVPVAVAAEKLRAGGAWAEVVTVLSVNLRERRLVVLDSAGRTRKPLLGAWPGLERLHDQLARAPLHSVAVVLHAAEPWGGKWRAVGLWQPGR